MLSTCRKCGELLASSDCLPSDPVYCEGCHEAGLSRLHRAIIQEYRDAARLPDRPRRDAAVSAARHDLRSRQARPQNRQTRPQRSIQVQALVAVLTRIALTLVGIGAVLTMYANADQLIDNPARDFHPSGYNTERGGR